MVSSDWLEKIFTDFDWSNFVHIVLWLVGFFFVVDSYSFWIHPLHLMSLLPVRLIKSHKLGDWMFQGLSFFDRSISWPTDFLTRSVIGWCILHWALSLADRLSNELFDWLTEYPIALWLADRISNELCDWLTEYTMSSVIARLNIRWALWLVDWTSDELCDWPTDYPMSSLIGWWIVGWALWLVDYRICERTVQPAGAGWRHRGAQKRLRHAIRCCSPDGQLYRQREYADRYGFRSSFRDEIIKWVGCSSVRLLTFQFSFYLPLILSRLYWDFTGWYKTSVRTIARRRFFDSP